MLYFLKLGQICYEIAMQIESFEFREMSEVVIQLCDIVMRDIDPLQLGWSVHDTLENCLEAG